jgi:hypothetical protein
LLHNFFALGATMMNMIEKFNNEQQMNLLEQMDNVRNDAIKEGISPDNLPPPMDIVILRTFLIVVLFNFLYYIISQTMICFTKKNNEETLSVDKPTTLKRQMPLNDDSDEDANPPPPLKRTRFEHMGKPLSPLLNITVQLEENEHSTNKPTPQYRIRIPLLPPSPPSSDSE